MRSRSQRDVAKELANVSFRPRPSSPRFFDPVVIVIAGAKVASFPSHPVTY